MSVKSVTSYVEDTAHAHSFEQPQVSGITGYTDKQGNFYQPGSTVAFTGTTANVTTGANLFAALRLAPSLPPGSVLVTVLFDSGGRYLSSPCWEAP